MDQWVLEIKVAARMSDQDKHQAMSLSRNLILMLSSSMVRSGLVISRKNWRAIIRLLHWDYESMLFRKISPISREVNLLSPSLLPFSLSDGRH